MTGPKGESNSPTAPTALGAVVATAGKSPSTMRRRLAHAGDFSGGIFAQSIGGGGGGVPWQQGPRCHGRLLCSASARRCWRRRRRGRQSENRQQRRHLTQRARGSGTCKPSPWAVAVAPVALAIRRGCVLTRAANVQLALGATGGAGGHGGDASVVNEPRSRRQAHWQKLFLSSRSAAAEAWVDL